MSGWPARFGLGLAAILTALGVRLSDVLSADRLLIGLFVMKRGGTYSQW